MKKYLDKARAFFARALDSIAGRRVDETLIEEMEELLVSAGIKADTAFETAEKLKGLRGAVNRNDLLVFLSRELRGLYTGKAAVFPPPKGTVLVLFGVNGVGKTSACAKLGQYLARNGRTVVFGACDTFRNGAIEQLTILAERLKLPVIKQGQGADPAAVAFDALQFMQSRGYDHLIIDTSGRAHTRQGLVDELKKIVNVLSSRAGKSALWSCLVLDAVVGHNGLDQAKVFFEAVAMDSIALCKLDATPKAGMALSAAAAVDVPISFVCHGEGLNDMEPFDIDTFIKDLLA